jgi:hypothetical protein
MSAREYIIATIAVLVGYIISEAIERWVSRDTANIIVAFVGLLPFTLFSYGFVVALGEKDWWNALKCAALAAVFVSVFLWLFLVE